MIVGFRDDWLRAFFVDDVRSKRIPPDLETRLFRKLPKGLGKPGVLPFAQDELGEEQKPRPPLPGLLGQGAEGLEELP